MNGPSGGSSSQEPSPADIEAVTDLLGRKPACRFEVLTRRRDGVPMVIANDPLLLDGTPMPTRYWLVDAEIRIKVGQLESKGGVKAAEASVSRQALAEAHRCYAEERDTLLPTEWNGPRPSGGVGGTRVGVKCLHAHVAWWLAGGNDPVGEWVADQIGLTRGEAP